MSAAGGPGMPPSWAEVQTKSSQVDKVNPAAIQGAAEQFKQASTDAGDHSTALRNATNALQGGVWDGQAADSFFAYVKQVGAAGDKVKDHLDEVAGELTKLQQDLAEIKGKIKSEHDDAAKEIGDRNTTAQQAIARANTQAQQAATGNGAPPNPDAATILNTANTANEKRASTAKTKIEGLLRQADEMIGKAQKLMKTEIDGGFSKVPPPGSGGGGGTAPSSTGGIQGTSSHGGGGHSGGGGASGGGAPGGGGGLGPSGGPPATQPPGNVEQWIKEAIKILQANGIPVTDADIDKIWTIIEKESGGNPNAINNWDSNAAAGHPSKGLMQCIDSTFQAHKLPGHDDIYNPVDSIIAGVRYTFDRYGGFAGHPGLASMASGGGYRGY